MTVLTGRIRVAGPPEQAFHLFTPLGERDWAEGWDPHFPEPVADDSAPGTVFVNHGATWMVVEREPGRRMRYARVVPDVNAGTVTVDLADAGRHSDVTVTYELTALSPDGARRLDEFAAGYADYLKSWEEAITRALGPTATSVTQALGPTATSVTRARRPPR